MKTTIEWTEETWNPVTGCSKVSEGCRNCYAERLDKRFNKSHKPWTTLNAMHNVQMHPERLTVPIKKLKPTMWFVNSMSDLFHEQVPLQYIALVFDVMAKCEKHTFQILTKRPARMKEIMGQIPEYVTKLAAGFDSLAGKIECGDWPLSNVWLGVSVENQQAADDRIPLLLQTPAAIRFLSCEPLLGTVNLEVPMPGIPVNGIYPPWYIQSGIDWVIAGGESGQNARPMHPDWVRSLRDQCQAAGVAFFFKQWGEWAPMFEQPWDQQPRGNCEIINLEGGSGYHGAGAMWTKKVGKSAAGRELDGRTWDEMPERGLA